MDKEVWWKAADVTEVIQLVYDTEVTADAMQHCMSCNRKIMNDVHGGISGKIVT
jgi:hypothetical protein